MNIKKKKNKYWIQLIGPGSLSQLIIVPDSEHFNPRPEYLIPINKFMSMSFEENVLATNETLMKKLVYRPSERMETGTIYKFVGYED